jgi:hypothetical protein
MAVQVVKMGRRVVVGDVVVMVAKEEVGYTVVGRSVV